MCNLGAWWATTVTNPLEKVRDYFFEANAPYLNKK